jgi:hypothetical protein
MDAGCAGLFKCGRHSQPYKAIIGDDPKSALDKEGKKWVADLEPFTKKK